MSELIPSGNLPPPPFGIHRGRMGQIVGKEIVGRKRRERKMGKREEIQTNWVFYNVRRKYDEFEITSLTNILFYGNSQKIITKIKCVLTLIY